MLLTRGGNHPKDHSSWAVRALETDSAFLDPDAAGVAVCHPSASILYLNHAHF